MHKKLTLPRYAYFEPVSSTGLFTQVYPCNSDQLPSIYLLRGSRTTNRDPPACISNTVIVVFGRRYSIFSSQCHQHICLDKQSLLSPISIVHLSLYIFSALQRGIKWGIARIQALFYQHTYSGSTVFIKAIQ